MILMLLTVACSNVKKVQVIQDALTVKVEPDAAALAEKASAKRIGSKYDEENKKKEAEKKKKEQEEAMKKQEEEDKKAEEEKRRKAEERRKKKK